MENKMNARIKEIEIQSVFYNEDTQSWEFDRKKFAELIVKECAELMPQDNLYKMVLKHFGVEE
jgi:hypothetical protein